MKDYSLENRMVCELIPPEQTIASGPDPDDLRVHPIDAEVLQVGMLSERTQLAINEFNTEHGDQDIQICLLQEWLIHDAECQKIMSGVANRIDRLIKDMAKQAY